MARFTLIGVAVVLTLMATAWVIEGIRGKRAWDRYRAEMAAAGETLNPEDLKPTPVPDRENFAMTPLLAPALAYRYTDQPGRHASDWPEIEWNDAKGKKRLDDLGKRFRRLWDYETRHQTPLTAELRQRMAVRTPPMTDRHRGRSTDLVAWQARIRTDPELALPEEKLSPKILHSGTGDDPPTVSYDTNFAAREVLLALSAFDPEMDELHAAAGRPHAQFPIHYHEGFATLLPHLQFLRDFARLAHLKAAALLAENRPDEALRELLLIARFTDSFRDEPTLVSGLVYIAMNHQMAGLAWEGIVGGKWKPKHLAVIEKRFRKVDLITSFRRAIRGERAMSMRTFLDYRFHRGALFHDDSRDGMFIRWMPSGVFYQNLVNLGRMYDEYVLTPVDFERRVVDLEKARIADDRMQEAFENFDPYMICAKAAFPAFKRALQRYAEGQSEVDQARLACALELYRAAKGRLPATLADLVPDQMPELPHDPVNGLSYVYRPNGDDYTIYSLGADNIDNGGQIEWEEKNPKHRDRDRGDWVWFSSTADESP